MRTDIQVLRGIAVLAVMLAHFGALLPGGFLGVDIFFAISGFVITLSFMKLRSHELNHRNVLRKFWQRRFWRLFPALSVVLTVTLATAFFVLPVDDFRDQLEMTVWSFFFAGNIGVEVVSQQDYFDPAANFNWLLHLWSLGVEEQFYLVFPFIMLLLLSRFRGASSQTAVLSAVIIGSAISFSLAGMNEFELAFFDGERLTEATGFSAALGYYSPLTRAWQFGVGIVAALLSPSTANVRGRSLLSVLGITVLALSLLLMPESNLLPGPLTLIPMAAMFILLRYPLSPRVTDSRLAKPLSWLGDRSYSAYLWHWPVWSVLTQLFNEGASVIVSALIATLALAAVTYRYIERPLINRYRQIEAEEPPRAVAVRRKRLSLGVVLVAPLLLIGLIVTAEQVLRDTGVIGQRATVPRIDPALDCLQTSCDGEEVDVLLVGDSHAGALANALASTLTERNLTMRGAIVARHFGCLHLPSEGIASPREECRDLSAEVRETISELSPRWVVIYGYTAGRFTTINSGGVQEIDLVNTQSGQPIQPGEGFDAYRDALDETIGFILSSGSQVIIVNGTPDFDLRPEDTGQDGSPATLAEVFFAPVNGKSFGQVVSRTEFDARHGDFLTIESSAAAASSLVKVVDSWAALCEADSCSQVEQSGALMFADQDHISELGAEKLASVVADAFSE